MNLGDVLDVAIGLALTYFLASLVASAVKEMVASIFQWRGHFLEKGLQVLLSTEKGSSFSYGPLWILSLCQHLLPNWALNLANPALNLGNSVLNRIKMGWRQLFPTNVPSPTPAQQAAADKVRGVLTHTLITGTPTKRPTYIPARDFSTALFDKLGGAASGTALAAHLVTMVQTAVANDPDDAVKANLRALLQPPVAIPDLIAQANQVRTTLAALPAGGLRTELANFVGQQAASLNQIGARVDALPPASEIRIALTALIAYVRQPGGNLDNLRQTVEALAGADVKTALTAFINGSGDAPDILARVKNTVAALPDCDIKSALTAFIQQTDGDLEKLRKRIELWFDDAMDRLSGIYKRFAQFVLFGLGLVIAIGLNVDTVHLAVELWTQPPVRAAMVAQAQTIVARQDPKQPLSLEQTKTNLAEAENSLKSLPVPVGRAANRGLFSGEWGADHSFWSGWSWWIIAGWLISAFAISLGAPFWFDTMQGALSMRAAGPQPPRSDQPLATH